MLILRTPHEMQEWSRTVLGKDQAIGFVPTMGALHIGHESLLSHSVSANDVTVLSIFVNPTQFNVAEDFDKYPRTFDTDVEIAKKNRVDVVYAPTVDSMYSPQASVKVAPGTASSGMEGAMRPGHFSGVTTVVAKLFNAVLPHRAYFGKKDYQQLAVIKQMVSDLDFPIEIVGIDTIRDDDGVAFSSRNVRLSHTHRQAATSISRGLFEARRQHLSGACVASHLAKVVTMEISATNVGEPEYVEVCDPVQLTPITNTSAGAVICVAAWFGDVRLIDNIELAPL